MLRNKLMCSERARSCQKKFCSVFSQKSLTDLKTNFTKFHFSATFRFQDMIVEASLQNAFPIGNFARAANYK